MGLALRGRFVAILTMSAPTFFRWLLVVALWCGAAVRGAAAPEIGQGPTISQVTLGRRASGEELLPEALRHRVVLVVFWNRTSEACREVMPALEQAHRCLGPAGLLIVASHVGRGTLAEVRQAVAKLGVTFPVVDDSSVEGLDPPDPPFALLFDHVGGCIARGSPADVAAPMTAALREAPPVVLAGRRLAALGSLERMLRDEAHFGTALRKAVELAKSADEATAAEAAYVVEQLTAESERLLARAASVKPDDPASAAALVQRVMNAYRGTDVAREATNLLREWRQERPFIEGLQAADLAAQLEALRTQALVQAGGFKVAPTGQFQPPPRVASLATAAKVSPHAKAQLGRVAAMIRRLAPGSRYAERAEEISLELGLDLPPAP